jgi:hypothetical protein
VEIKCLLIKFLLTQQASSGPTHKRTKERAPVWGSEFVLKAAILQGGVSEGRAQLLCMWALAQLLFS